MPSPAAPLAPEAPAVADMLTVNPVPELTGALQSHAFGIGGWDLLEDGSDNAKSAPASSSSAAAAALTSPSEAPTPPVPAAASGAGLGGASVAPAPAHGQRLVIEGAARARVQLLAGEGEVVVVLDHRGYTIQSSTSTAAESAATHAPFESLDALLIAASPAYVAAMNSALAARLEAGGLESRWNYDEDEDVEEPAWID